jgi:predicted transcriptional regulator
LPDDASPSSHVTLRLPAEIVERFDRIAALLERPRSWVMLRALRQYLESEGAELAADAASLAQFDRGEAAPFEGVIKEVERVIKQAGKKRAR